MICNGVELPGVVSWNGFLSESMRMLQLSFMCVHMLYGMYVTKFVRCIRIHPKQVAGVIIL